MCAKNLDNMIYSSWDIECHRLLLVIMGYFFHFYNPLPPLAPLPRPPTPLKNKKKKKNAGYIIILHVCQKPQSYDVCFLRYGVQQTDFFVILGHFLPFYHTIDPKNWNLGKKSKKTWRYYLLTHVYHTWRSCDVWLLRYKAQQIEFFVILGDFLPFDPPKPKNQNFGKWEKHLEISLFYTCVP